PARPPHQWSQPHGSDAQRRNDRRIQPAAACDTEPVKQSAEAECRQDDRSDIELRVRLLGDIPEYEICDYEVEDDNRQYDVEQTAPRIDFNKPAGQCRYDGRGKTEYQAEEAHRGPSLFPRIDKEQSRLHQRPDDAGA